MGGMAWHRMSPFRHNFQLAWITYRYMLCRLTGSTWGPATTQGEINRVLMAWLSRRPDRLCDVLTNQEHVKKIKNTNQSITRPQILYKFTHPSQNTSSQTNHIQSSYQWNRWDLVTSHMHTITLLPTQRGRRRAEEADASGHEEERRLRRWAMEWRGHWGRGSLRQ
jgi:hypothetical protein